MPPPLTIAAPSNATVAASPPVTGNDAVCPTAGEAGGACTLGEAIASGARVIDLDLDLDLRTNTCGGACRIIADLRPGSARERKRGSYSC